MSVTCILTVYNRHNLFLEQLEAVQNQTIKPTQVYVWVNGASIPDMKAILAQSKVNKDNVVFFECSDNLGVWPRFFLGLNCKTDYICILDDDTMPGSKWFENCIASYKHAPDAGVFSTIGVIVGSPDYPFGVHRFGWDGGCADICQVDYAGHSWFFKRGILSVFARDIPPREISLKSGEDMHLSYTVQRYTNLKTYIPPHPASDPELWGSNAVKAMKYGTENNTSGEAGFLDRVRKSYNYIRDRGFKQLSESHSLDDIKQNKHTRLLKGNSVQHLQYFLAKLRERENFAIARPGDGEYLILTDSTLSTQDNWTYTSGGALRLDLHNALNVLSAHGGYMGIPCETCNKAMCKHYIDTYPRAHMTYANIFVNANWKTWIEALKGLKRQVVYIGPGELSQRTERLPISRHIKIGETLVNTWDRDRANVIATFAKEFKDSINQVYLISAGPIAKILVAYGAMINDKNTYIDTGSSIDIFTKGSSNRMYYDGGQYSTLVCDNI